MWGVGGLGLSSLGFGFWVYLELGFGAQSMYIDLNP